MKDFFILIAVCLFLFFFYNIIFPSPTEYTGLEERSFQVEIPTSVVFN